jgi:hypothetical protein
MALTGNTVQSTYLDLVQLEQSGAGLPSHAGKEAALYDGSGAQILGRSAVRHWLDPHPDAASFAETWEFSTTGDMNQAALESAGWTFSDCTAAVSGGTLWITTAASASPWSRAYYATTSDMSGDFDLIFELVGCQPGQLGVSEGTNNHIGTAGVGVNGDPGILQQIYLLYGADRHSAKIYHTGTWTVGGGTGGTSQTFFYPSRYFRISRSSGTIYLYAGAGFPASDNSFLSDIGWRVGGSVAESSTYDRIHVSNWVAANADNESSATFGVRSIRRFQ